MKGKKNTKKTSKKQKSEETPLVPTLLTIVDEKKVVEEEAQQLYNQVSEINQQFINEGNTILLEKLPQKIQQLSEFIKVGLDFAIKSQLQNQPLFYVSMDEIKKEICKTVEESIALCKETRKEVIQYKKDLNKSFNKWRKDEHAICSNLKKTHNSIQTQVAFEKLEDMINQDHIFSINKV